jgi:beta-lactamase regulating signal transducer with metallopeptidase domain
MFPIEQSAFLQALGRAIGNSLWQVAAIWLLYTAITGLFTLNASRKYQFATIASLAGFLWFAATFFYTYVNAPLQGYKAVYTFTDANENVDRSSFVNQALYLYHSVLASLKSLSPYISCGYLLVFLLLGIRLVNGFRQVKFFATQGLGKVDVQWRLFVQRNAEILQIKQRVNVFSSQYVQSPLTMGFWKPIILLPVASLNSLSTQQVEAILLHELAHIRRHDYLVNIFVQIAEICLFFNPFMRLLLKQIRQERENSCDDYVLQFQYNAKDYAKALLTIEKNNAATLLALSAKDNQSFQLLSRVKRMVAPQPHAFNYRQQLYMLLLLTILGLGFTVIVPKPKIKTPVASAGHPNKYVGKKDIADAKKAPAIPSVPAAFDLVKTIQVFTENLNLKEIEAQAEIFGKEAEEAGKAYGEQVERQMQPYVEDITRWAEKFSDNAEATAKLEAAAKDLENLEFNEKTLRFTNIDAYMAPALQKLNDAMKSFPKMNVKIAAPTFNIPPLPPINTPIATAPVFPFESRDIEEKIRITNDRKRQTAENTRATIELRKAVEQAKMQHKAEIEAEINDLHQQQENRIAYNFNSNAKSFGKKISKAVICKPNDEDESDEPEADADNEDEETSFKNVFAKSKSANGKAFSYTIKLPEMVQLKGLEKDFHFEFNNPFAKKNKIINRKVEKRASATNSASRNITTTEDVENISEADIDSDDIKTIDIQQRRQSKNGKIENVVIIRIIPTR